LRRNIAVTNEKELNLTIGKIICAEYANGLLKTAKRGKARNKEKRGEESRK
jgi:hypothetical protein